MNERIKELCLQAGTCVTNSNGQYTFDEFLAFQEKFAELIVRECADVIQKEVSFKYANGGEEEEFMNGHYAASLLARVVIKNHFGVRVE